MHRSRNPNRPTMPACIFFPAIVPGMSPQCRASRHGQIRTTALVHTQRSATIDIVLKPSDFDPAVSVQDCTPYVIDLLSVPYPHSRAHPHRPSLPSMDAVSGICCRPFPAYHLQTATCMSMACAKGNHDSCLTARPHRLFSTAALGRALAQLARIEEVHGRHNASSAKFTLPGHDHLSDQSGVTYSCALFETNPTEATASPARQQLTNTVPPLNRNEYGAAWAAPFGYPKSYNGNNVLFLLRYEGYKLRRRRIQPVSRSHSGTGPAILQRPGLWSAHLLSDLQSIRPLNPLRIIFWRAPFFGTYPANLESPWPST